MKTIVSVLDLAEVDIKPALEIEQFHELLESDVRSLWGGNGQLIEVSCPGCDADENRFAFDRFGLPYVECVRCATLYLRCRPTDVMVRSYYETAASARFWREKILAATEDARREKVVRPRVEWVTEGISELNPNASLLMDISSNADQFREELSELLSNKVRVLEGVEPDLPSRPSLDVITAFEVLDRAANVPALVTRAAAALKPGGLLFLTAPAASGFETQVLWDQSPTPVPPDKMNLLTVEGFQARFGLPDWNVVELSTPGLLDIETVRRAVQRNPERDWPRFVRYLVTRRGEQALTDFVEFLQANRLASFARLVVRRVGK